MFWRLRAWFTEQGKLAWDFNPSKVAMGVENEMGDLLYAKLMFTDAARWFPSWPMQSL